ncbi:host factor-I protein [Cupriavidus sp. YR651]|uniref:RNA chaperone Hfq n=1 Tax=Cupriavidus sp. YR651 TaxID=1855315 RepID=UPI0008851FC9|nr:RNA chaperone Hfq [Cupriavidus sp. YR651]SDC64138.1 host factor-I protein [Cupriavidus sp. YR651]
MKKEIKAPRPSRKLQHLQFAAHSASRNSVIVHLSNGTRLTGIVVASDNYMLLLGRDAEDPTPTLVYKRAITVVTPAHAPEAAATLLEAEASPDFVRLYIPRTRKRR